MTPDPIRAALNGLRILINEYDPNNSDWFFRKGCMLELLLDIAIALPIGVPVPGDPETTLLRIISDILEKTGLSAKPMRLSDLGDAIVAEMERRVAAETSTLKMALHDVTDGITAACNEAEIRADEREKCAKVADEHSFGCEIDWWLNATKKDVAAETCRSIAAAIRGGAK